MIDCIDLRPWCKANSYRFRLEESFAVETIAEVRGDGCGYVEVLCKRGLIYPLGGGDNLLACVEGASSRPGIALKLLLDLDPEVKIKQAGATVQFPSRLLDQVAVIMRPRQKRKGNPEGPSLEARNKGLQAIKENREREINENQ